MADLYFLYGKALLENAISQTSVLGKDQVEEELESTKSSDIISAPLLAVR
jgi:HAT1-interacting factor 1